MDTIVEKEAIILILIPLKKRSVESVRKALAKVLKNLPQQMTFSMIYDHGKEMEQHNIFTEETKMQLYFCDSHSPWKCGKNGNTIMLIRDLFLNETDFSEFIREEIMHVQKLLNARLIKI
jgi:IS30 family transposase